MAANAVELTVEQAWYIADTTGCGSFPWVLAITPPYSEPSSAEPFAVERIDELTELGVMSAGRVVNPAVAQWIRQTCQARQWLEMRVVAPHGDMLRGLVGRSDDATVVALRSGGLVTFTAMDIHAARDLVPVLVAGLAGQRPAEFEDFTVPVRAGARADEKLRAGADLTEILDYLGISSSARQVVESVFTERRSYVEIVAGEHRDGHRVSTEVGVSVLDCPAGRILASPQRAFDGEWVSTFAPGSDSAIAAAIDNLIATLPGGPWFAPATHNRDFDQRTENRCPTTL
ncbi:ESX secretion-associated protein EspG [Mycolicibacterium neoaurum]|uniref:ESX secretion-associated protein EspG n=1 Tax=Mycolicibacterium neoaurum TaxID=1795 RepID=UPI00248C9987|nr:ESX secretion-associated protein EspG [Mycolicibacterium neoaurum]MDO3400244.1 ESX secretion-associated protein EspG [Mycolicibacterium neoaurum]WBP92698.1 ESX secretion-associated protein EspG [Mycolicibacterium neoaurum]WBS06260.1 ESX secretion-associated protein EspG [Mycolicibacterium neoaurum]